MSAPCGCIPAAPQHTSMSCIITEKQQSCLSVCTTQVITDHHTSTHCKLPTALSFSFLFFLSKSPDFFYNRMEIRGTFLQQKRSEPVRTCVSARHAWLADSARGGLFFCCFGCVDGKMDWEKQKRTTSIRMRRKETKVLTTVLPGGNPPPPPAHQRGGYSRAPLMKWSRTCATQPTPKIKMEWTHSYRPHPLPLHPPIYVLFPHCHGAVSWYTIFSHRISQSI